MKEIEISHFDKVIEQTIPIKLKHLGTFRKKIPGGKVFELDISTLIVAEVEYTPSDRIDIKGNPENHKMVIKKNKVYVEAINMANAIKKFEKGNIMFRT